MSYVARAQLGFFLLFYSRKLYIVDVQYYKILCIYAVFDKLLAGIFRYNSLGSTDAVKQCLPYILYRDIFCVQTNTIRLNE